MSGTLQLFRRRGVFLTLRPVNSVGAADFTIHCRQEIHDDVTGLDGAGPAEDGDFPLVAAKRDRGGIIVWCVSFY
ncbi:hypothetical protein AL490_009235 [Achromobacter xylosoxidans]|nr:hypothetical protein AL490_009235 [Achromobacter xylosoxidans]